MNKLPEFRLLPTPMLEYLARELELKIIDGSADDEDINGYIHAQIELASRSMLDFLLDPRD